VSGAGSSERLHKLMNTIEDKKRNRLKWDNVEDFMYVAHNAVEVRKRKRVRYETNAIPWADPLEENAEWEDA
ncbi:hypothetical protein CYMTET_30832, partial [Cymbomonas tetramitiformis]